MSTTYYNDGGSHTHSSSSTGVNADVPGDTDAGAGVWVSDATTVDITGGTQTGGDGDATYIDGPGVGLHVEASDITITAGTFVGGSNGWASGAPAARILLPTACAIVDGTFTGGDAGGDANGGTALALATDGVSITIDDGVYTGGAGAGSGSAGYSLGISIAGGADVEISGGLWTGDWGVNLVSGSTLTVYGLFDTATASALVGTLSNGDAIDVAIISLDATITTTGSQPPNGVRYYS